VTSVFAANGFTGTTTNQITKAAGGSEALRFKHFPTKQALYTAILAEKAQYSGLREAVEEATKRRDDERLFTLLADYRVRRGAGPALFRLLLFSTLEGHELFQQVFSAISCLSRSLSRLHSPTHQGWRVPPSRPLLAAKAFFGVILHHRLLHDIFGLPMHLSHEATVVQYVSLFLGGFVRQPPDF
jgi:AcrR family transcriptional regulator